MIPDGKVRHGSLHLDDFTNLRRVEKPLRNARAMIPTPSEHALILAPKEEEAATIEGILAEAGIPSRICASLGALSEGLEEGAGFAIIAQESLHGTDLTGLSAAIGTQADWSDMAFILLTDDGLADSDKDAAHYLDRLGNVLFLERPFRPITLVAIAKSLLRARRRQYAHARLDALRESEGQFRSLANSIPAIVWIANPDGHVYWYNQQMYDYTGTLPEEMENDGWQKIHDPEVLPEVIDKWSSALATSTAFEMVFPLLGKDGIFRPFLTRSQPVRDVDGRIVRWLGTATNIQAQRDAEAALEERASELERRVEERTAEREAALAQLHEAQKLETLGQLTGGVAHDFNNLLTPITGVLDLLQRKYGDDDDREARLIAGALQSADRAKTLVQRLLGFARRQALQMSAVDVAGLIDGMHELIASSVGPSIELEIRKGADLSPALVDPNQLELAILNLCVNARDAMPNGGSLIIALERAAVAQHESTRLEPGSYLRLSVLDTGVGMDPDTLRRAIEPFFSTKGIGKGTGLGLSMIHGLAAQLGGDFELSSIRGQGTRADLWLPVAKDSHPAAPRPSEEGEIPAGRLLRVLLVDDEDLVRAGTAEMLRDLGHEVVETCSGADALDIFSEDMEFDAVITDYMMPRMDGAELARRIGELAPDMPVLLITGYADGTSSDPELPRLAKPFRQAGLAARLHAVVESKGKADPRRQRRMN